MKRCLKCANCRYWMAERAAHLAEIAKARNEKKAEECRVVWNLLQTDYAEYFGCLAGRR